MNKYLFIVIGILLSIISGNNAVPTTEETEANKILAIIGDSNICSTFQCSANDANVIGIDLHNLNKVANLGSIDFSVFTQLSLLNLRTSNVIAPSNILTQISSLQNLQKFYITSLVEGIDVNFPSSLTEIGMDNFKGVFYAKWVNSNLEILSVVNSVGFSLSGTFAQNTKLYQLEFPVPSNGLPNLDQCFPSLTSLKLYMKDITYTAGSVVPSSYLGSFNFNDLSTLIFTFDSNTTSNNPSLTKPIYLPDLSYLSQLHVLEFNGEIFVLNPTNQILDLSNNPVGQLSLTIQRTKKLFNGCNNCIRVSENAACSINYANVKVDNLNFYNCSKIKLSVIDPVQEVTFKGFNFDRLTSIDISSSNFNGELVDDICKVNYQYVSIKSNFFTKPPSCYVCTSDLVIRSKILPNNFTDFTSNSPASCPGFSAQVNSSYSVNTIADSIYINGKDLGFSIQVTGAVADYEYESINYRIRIDTQPYKNGNGAVDKAVTVTLSGTNTVLNFVYHYAAPVISSYKYISDSKIIYFFGSNFDFSNSSNNLVTISTLEKPLFLTAIKNQNALSLFNVESGISLINVDQSFTIKVQTGGQESNVASFVFTPENIQITSENIVLKSTGSTATISGSFLSNDISKVNLSIDNVTCLITQFNSTSLTFTYPGSYFANGISTLLLSVDGKGEITQVTIENIQEDPYSSSSLSSSSSSSLSASSSSNSKSTSSNNSDSDSDSLNSSFKLNFNFVALISFIIISSLII